MKTTQVICSQLFSGARKLPSLLLGMAARTILASAICAGVPLVSGCIDPFEFRESQTKPNNGGGSSGTQSQGNKLHLIGTWTLRATTGLCSDPPQRLTCYPGCPTIVFNSDGTYTESNGSSGTYQIDEFLELSGSGPTETYSYKIDDTTLEITLEAIGNNWSHGCYMKEYKK